MKHTTNLLLLQLMMVVSIRPTDYVMEGRDRFEARCKRELNLCGPFQHPQDPVGEYECVPKHRVCKVKCALSCPSEDGRNDLVVQPRNNYVIYHCKDKQWRTRETLVSKPFCRAKSKIPEVAQNLYEKNVDELNHLVNNLLNTSYFYLGMSTFYDRADVALPGFSKFMADLWTEEMAQARDIIQYVNKRGGYIYLNDLSRPSSHELLMMSLSKKPGLSGMLLALQTNKDVHSRTLELLEKATKKGKSNDPNMKHYLEDGLLSAKVDKVKAIADLVTRLEGFSDEDYTVGEYVLDTELRS